ncbi:hypothetical protein [Brevibacillus borstelensis]|uniref:hypothetical protein n=1 Tax=Brevibacillus borstelensis TaxID=45462 RepID=UPI0030BBAEA0
MKLFTAVILSVLLLCGCSQAPSEQEVLEIITAYNKAKYELNQEEFSLGDKEELHPLINERVKKWLTENDYKKFWNNRDAGITVEEAKRGRIIQIKDIKIGKLAPTDDNKALNVEYTMVYAATIRESNQTTEYQVNGQATVVMENDTLKIDRHWDSLNWKELGLP